MKGLFMVENSLHDYLQNDIDEIVSTLKNLDFLTLRIFLESREKNSSPINLFKNICLSIKDVGNMLHRYPKTQSLGVTLAGLSIQLYDYSDDILFDDEVVTLLEIIVQENYLFFTNAQGIPLDGYEEYLKPTIFENIDTLLRRLPNRSQ